MQIELNWSTFRRLVQLELLLLIALILAVAIEVLIPGYAAFDVAFDELAAEHGFDDAPDILIVPISGLLITAYVGSLVGMLRGSRAARNIYFATFVLGWPCAWLLSRPVTWSANVTDFVLTLGAMVSGALLLLAYSRDHGQIWFNQTASKSEF